MKIFIPFLILFSFLFCNEPLMAQQTSIGLSFRPDYEWNFDYLLGASGLEGGLSYSNGLQFQHDFVDSKLGFRVGLFSIERKYSFHKELIITSSSTFQVVQGKLLSKAAYLSIPITLVFKPKPKIELTLGFTPQYFIYSATYVGDVVISFNSHNENPVHIGVVSSFDCIVVDKKWFNLKLGAVTIWPMARSRLIAGLQLSSHFKFP